MIDMVRDSFHLQQQVKWYTSMIGRKKNLIAVERLLKWLGFSKANVRVTSFIQGKTTRWGIGWTFEKMPARTASECI